MVSDIVKENRRTLTNEKIFVLINKNVKSEKGRYRRRDTSRHRNCDSMLHHYLEFYFKIMLKINVRARLRVD